MSGVREMYCRTIRHLFTTTFLRMPEQPIISVAITTTNQIPQIADNMAAIITTDLGDLQLPLVPAQEETEQWTYPLLTTLYKMLLPHWSKEVPVVLQTLYQCRTPLPPPSQVT